MSLPGWWYMSTPGPMTSVPSLFNVLITLRIAIPAPVTGRPAGRPAIQAYPGRKQVWPPSGERRDSVQRGGRGPGRGRQRDGDPGDGLVVVRGGHEPRLERRRRQVYAAVQHRVEEGSVGGP